MNIIKLKESIQVIEFLNTNIGVLHIVIENKRNYLKLVYDAEIFRREFKDKFGKIAPKFTEESWNDFFEYLRENSTKGIITDDSYTKELAYRILLKDSSLTSEQTTEEKIQSVLDSMDIIIPAVVFKHLFADWGFPTLKRRNFEVGTLTEIVNELRNGVLPC